MQTLSITLGKAALKSYFLNMPKDSNCAQRANKSIFRSQKEELSDKLSTDLLDNSLFV